MYRLEVEVLNIRKEKNSKYGNPKWHFILRKKETDFVFWAETETNSSCAYRVTYDFINYDLVIYGNWKGNMPFRITELYIITKR